MTISAKVIADSKGEDAPRLTTLQLRYPKFIHGELMTHRVFSRNASSSRAIPVERLIDDVRNDPVYPSHWGANQKGMQADEECSALIDEWPHSNLTREAVWDAARDNAVTKAEAFARAGYHKQIVNRLLEPFCHINVVVTSTEWSNFFALRCHAAAQPEMRLLAEAMRTALNVSRPVLVTNGRWHLPYVDPDQSIPQTHQIRCSVARCARVSYLTQDGKPPSIADDLTLYDRLMAAKPLHASPAEHQATPDMFRANRGWQCSRRHGNFNGWIQYRKTLEGESM